MPRKPPQRDPSAAYVRDAIAARRIAGRKCACGEGRPWALIAKSDPVECYECRRKREGKTTFDNHHLAGKTNNLGTVPTPVNDHIAELNTAQYDWPKQTLENPEGCPLLAAAACVRGVIDYLHYLINKFLVWIPEMLESLSTFLRENMGAKWWVGTELEKYAPRRRDHLPDNPNPTNNLPPEDAKSDNDVSARNPDEKLAA